METNDNTFCKAQPRTFSPDFKAYQKPEQPSPWGSLTPGSEKYFELFTETAVTLANKKKITLAKAYVELVKQGWKIDMYELDDDLKQILIDQGLLTGAGVAAEQQSGGTASPADSIAEAPVPLEDIIAAMDKEQQEGQK